jgi:exodeoxyribonuclease VII large subunit
MSHNPVKTALKAKLELKQSNTKIQIYMMNLISRNKSQLQQMHAELQALNPAAILQRGYSITRTFPEGRVIRHTDEVEIHQQVDVMLATGSMICRIERKQ